MAGSTPKFEGEEVQLGDRIYIVPALSMRQIRNLQPKLDLLDTDTPGLPSMKQLDAVVEVMHTALSRNYPDITVDELLDLIDLGNMTTLIKAVIRTSGLVPKEGKAMPGAASP